MAWICLAALSDYKMGMWPAQYSLKTTTSFASNLGRPTVLVDLATVTCVQRPPSRPPHLVQLDIRDITSNIIREQRSLQRILVCNSEILCNPVKVEVQTVPQYADVNAGQPVELMHASVLTSTESALNPALFLGRGGGTCFIE